MPAGPDAIAVLFLSLLSVVTTAAGVLLALLIRENTRAIATGIGFSTGIMVLISLAELIPEAQATLGLARALATVALGAAVLWGTDLVIPHGHLVREHGLGDTRLIRSAYLVVIGLVLHDLPEGFAMANAYIASPELGVVVAVAIALHNLPEELAMAVPAITLRSWRFLFVAAMLSALAEPLGALAGLAAVGASPGLNAHFLAFAAGAMLFVSLHELLPLARRYGRMGWFAGGVGLSLLVYEGLLRAVAGAPG